MSNSKTILLVEDEAIIAVIHKRILNKYGFDVITVATGEKAVETAASTPGIDLILMDIDLGEGIDGTEAAEQILADREIPLVFLSSHTEPEVVNKTEGITSYGYIVKNSGETVLIASIRMAFKLFDAKLQEHFRNEELHALNEELEASNEEYMTLQEELLHSVHTLQEKEQLLEGLLNLVPDMISIHDSDFNILYSNWQGFAAVPKNKRLINSKCYNVYRGLDAQCPDCFTGKVLYSKQRMRQEVLLPDGRFLDIQAIPLLDENNNLKAFMEWVRDISERKGHEERIKLMSEMLDEAPGAITVHDYEGNFLYANKNNYRLHGYDEDFLFRKLQDIDVPESAELIEERMRVIDKEGEAVFKADHYRKDGTIVPLEVSAKKVNWGGIPAVLSVAVDITNRINAEESLKTAEETYRNLFLNSQIGIFRSDVETGLILDANDTFARFAGYKDRESLLADSFNVAESYIDPQQRNLMISTLKETGVVSNFETIFKRIDDNLVWMRFSARHNSEKGWLEGVAEDITESKKAVDSLRENEVLLQKIIDNIPLSLTIVTVEGTPRYLNPQAIKLFEAESLENLQNLGAAFVWENPDDRKKWLEALKTRGIVNNYEAVIRTLSGERKFLLLSGLLLQYHGELCVLSIHSDITDRKLYEIALRESEEKYRMLFNYSPLGIYVADSDGNILDANDKLLSILGSPSLEATKSLNIFTLPLLTETGYADKFRGSIETNSVSSIEFNYTSRWGKTTYASNYIVPVADSAGRVGKVFTLVEDITLRKQIEKYRELSGEILSVLNSTDDLKDSVNRILLLIKEKTGSDAVGIRLCEGDDFPYFVQNGFSNDFILQENSLISRDTCGGVCVDNDGDVSLECTCGLVISGKTDPHNPLFTPGGSCWTNDSFPLLEMPESEDPRYKARNNCIHHGYASVALVPVKSKNEIVGLLQLNGYAKNLFTIELVQELEIIASRIGETLLRKQNEDKIKALLKEKELLLKETHHRVKNNMNTVYGLLYMQSEELSDPVSKSIIMEAASRVQSMMVMYDKLYRAEDQHEMNVNDYLPSLVDEIIRIFDSRIPVKADINVDDIVLSAKALSALGIIINELITNSMKYAFDHLNEGLISLSLRVKENQVTVVYSDNGPGIPESVDFDNSTGFGMQLIGMLVQQLGGSIKIERGEGTRFVLEFDL